MPAMLTHDFFGQDILADHPKITGGSREERDAFLLGNQGPDPLFYCVMHPGKNRYMQLGNIMHNEKPTELIAAFKQALSVLDAGELPIGRAYTHGFLCHYLLDSRMHPLIFAQEYRICDAGIDGLTRENKNEVHGVIESELDEMVLYSKLGVTIADYEPAANVLLASPTVLQIVQKLYTYVVLTVYGYTIDADLFPQAVRDFRRTQRLFYSPTGRKRALLARIEEFARPYSLLRAMAHRPIRLTSTWFANPDHGTWKNPFTGRACTLSFWDIYDQARAQAGTAFAMFDDDSFDAIASRTLTHDLNFSGDPVEASIVVHGDAS